MRYGSNAMKDELMMSRSVNKSSATRPAVVSIALRSILIDAAIGTASGGLFGIVFGAFGLLLAAESWSIATVAGYFAVCGAAAGAIVGGCRAVLEGDGAADPTGSFPFSAATSGSNFRRITPLAVAIDESTNPGDQPSRRLHRNRLMGIDPGRQAARGSMNPSRN